MENIKKLFGSNVRKYRLDINLSQEKLALEVGLDRTYITSVENGKRNISILNLEKIWLHFGLTPSQFFDSELFCYGQGGINKKK